MFISLNTDLATWKNHIMYFKTPDLNAYINFDVDTQIITINNIWYDKSYTIRVSGYIFETRKNGYFDFEIRITNYGWHVINKHSSDYITEITPKMSSTYGGYISVKLTSSYGTFTDDAKVDRLSIAYFKDFV